MVHRAAGRRQIRKELRAIQLDVSDNRRAGLRHHSWRIVLLDVPEVTLHRQFGTEADVEDGADPGLLEPAVQVQVAVRESRRHGRRHDRDHLDPGVQVAPEALPVIDWEPGTVLYMRRCSCRSQCRVGLISTDLPVALLQYLTGQAVMQAWQFTHRSESTPTTGVKPSRAMCVRPDRGAVLVDTGESPGSRVDWALGLGRPQLMIWSALYRLP